MYSTVSVGFNATGSPTTVTTTSGYVSGPESQQNVNGTVAPLGSVRQVPLPTSRETPECHQRMPVKRSQPKSPGRGIQGIRFTPNVGSGENKDSGRMGRRKVGWGLPPPHPPQKPFIMCTCLRSTIVGRQPMKIKRQGRYSSKWWLILLLYL